MILTRVHACLILCVGLPCLPNDSAGQARPASFPLTVDSVRIVGARAALGSAIGAKVGPGGVVYVADHLNAQVVAFSPEGRLLWRAGRRGRGPGEFQLPYRLAVRTDGSVLVLDRGAGEISVLSSAGAFLTRLRLPFAFSQIDDLVALPGGQVIIAGTTDASERARGHALHRFRASGQQLVHAGSFGPLPEARDPAVLKHWGAGPVQRVASGDLVYVRRIPYDIHRFEPGGRRRATIRPPFRTRGTPDDVIQIERRDGGMTISSTDADVERPGTVVEVNRWLLVTRISERATHWDLFSPSGDYVASTRVQEGWGAVVGFDSARGVLWLTSTQDLEPVLLRVHVSSGPGGPSPNRRRPS